MTAERTAAEAYGIPDLDDNDPNTWHANGKSRIAPGLTDAQLVGARLVSGTAPQSREQGKQDKEHSK